MTIDNYEEQVLATVKSIDHTLRGSNGNEGLVSKVNVIRERVHHVVDKVDRLDEQTASLSQKVNSLPCAPHGEQIDRLTEQVDRIRALPGKAWFMVAAALITALVGAGIAIFK